MNPITIDLTVLWGEWRQDRELQDIPVEWRSFRILGWNSFRDSHQYENVNQVTFSVSLDSPEVTTSIFGGTEIQHFYLVIDNTNNSHADDALLKLQLLHIFR